MRRHVATLFSELQQIAARPTPFGTYDSPSLWADPHISRMMLDAHLDPGTSAASFPEERIDACSEWIGRRFGIGPYTRVCDLGYGPGLWTSRFAARGAQVLGLDLSERSIRYAEDHARARGLPASYLVGDYLHLDIPGPFDLVTMIHGDFSVLSPVQSARLLASVRSALAENGRLLFDVSSADRFDRVDEVPMTMTWLPAGGFMAPGPHYHITARMRYAEERLILDKHTVIEPDRVRTICVWDQCYSLNALRSLLEEHGLRVAEVYSDVGGTPYAPGSDRFAVVAGRSGQETAVPAANLP